MIMKKHFSTLGAAALFGLLMLKGGAAEAATLDPEGYIRDWVMLAPIALPEGSPAADALLKEQVKDEAALKPKDGDKIKINGKELTWRKITAPTNYFDFNAILKTVNDHAAGFMVTYVECEKDMPDVTMAVGSNDEGRIYFNGVDIYAFTEARILELDADKGRVKLNKGVNVIVFKIINEQGNWQGAMRFLDKDGAPVKNLKIKLSP